MNPLRPAARGLKSGSNPGIICMRCLIQLLTVRQISVLLRGHRSPIMPGLSRAARAHRPLCGRYLSRRGPLWRGMGCWRHRFKPDTAIKIPADRSAFNTIGNAC